MEYLQYFGKRIPQKTEALLSFKPYYKWNTFNTCSMWIRELASIVLNLIINGIPSIQVINNVRNVVFGCFKPYYKWNTFNTWVSQYIAFFEIFKF